MKTKNNFSKRFLSVFLCITFLLSYIPALIITTGAADSAYAKTADPFTMDDWKNYFAPGTDNLSTENAGGVWTDKSVFTDDSVFESTGITKDKDNSFLVALSAIASNMTVTGKSNAPTDTMLILDMSSSMYNGSAKSVKTVDSMIKAVNGSIEKLLSLNVNNRVGVVIYYGGDYIYPQSTGNSSKLLLPLGRYSKGTNANYAYLMPNVSSGKLQSIQVSPNVKNESNATVSASTYTLPNVAGTYAQQGILSAMEQFLAADTVVPSTAEHQANAERMPIFVFMSDGEPTAATEDYANRNKPNATMGNNQVLNRQPAQTDFVTMLTASWAKEMVDAHYVGETPEFYTLSLGDSISLDVMNPESQNPASSGSVTEQINTYWDTLVRNNSVSFDTKYFINTDKPTVPTQIKNHTVNKVNITKGSNVIGTFPTSMSQRYYVDDAFTAQNAEDLSSAFSQIISSITLKSTYNVTLVDEDANTSGYVSFVDKVGDYMKVSDIKGILINNTLYSGADLAQNFAANANGGSLGTIEKPTALGDEMVWAVQARLGLDSSDDARTLIGLAYEHGQLSYTNKDNFSNYIGWYANAKGEFLGFWHEGITTMPDPNDGSLTEAERPVYIIKSYGYLGYVDEAHGVAKSDMMYATVQVRERIDNGEQMVTFAVPAALIPVVSYNVTLDEKTELSKLIATGAEYPICLVYEVELDDSINEYTLKDVVSDEYLANNTNSDGSVNFYTNQYETDNTTGYGKVNTYSYFNPSRQNDRYYYVQEALVYTDTAGTVYKGTAKPTGEMYRQHVSYTKNGETLKKVIGYHELTSDALDTAKWVEEEGAWYIPQGNVRGDFAHYSTNKAENKTGTLTYSNQPFVDTENHTLDDTGYNFIVGATLGNNGKITVGTETGIKITKKIADNATKTTAPFEFVITNMTNKDDDTTYPAYVIPVTGEAYSTTVKFVDGVAKVSLSDADVFYIGSMKNGDTLKIEETKTVEYVVYSVNSDVKSDYATLTVVDNVLLNAAFVNTNRGKGDFTVSKVVAHDFGTTYKIPADKTFDINVTLSGVGTANATFEAKQTNDSTITSITTDANGKFDVTLKHNEQLEVFGLPEGTVVTVVEENIDTGFTAQYYDNGTAGGNGVVTVEADNLSSVIVLNDYNAGSVTPDIHVWGTKILTGRQWQDDDEFKFELEKFDRENPEAWPILGTDIVKGTDAEKSFDFANAFKNEVYTEAGTYYYRVIEVVPLGGGIGGVAYDKTVHSFAVIVTDTDMDGYLEISEVKSSRPTTTIVTEPQSGKYDVQVNFTNTYSTTGNATVTIDLNKIVVNESLSDKATADGFTFGLYNKADGTRAFTSEPTTDRGFARFVLTYEDIGVYEYTLKEIKPTTVKNGWTYSEESYDVTVEVKDDGDGTISAVIYKGDNGANAGTSIFANFTNTYAPKNAELEIDFVDKQLSGKQLQDNQFDFAVTEIDGTVVLTGENDAQGNVNFNKKLEFDKVGIYFYNIVETSESGDGITVDARTFRIAVTVEDVDGELVARYELVNEVGYDIVFKNVYNTNSISHSIVGQKKLEGKHLINDEFTFVMKKAVDANGTVEAGTVGIETRNYSDGTFHFPEITYTVPGKYYYRIFEKPDSANNPGIKYDTSEYVVMVEIEDTGKGELIVSHVTTTVLGGETTNVVLFKNEYIANPTFAQIPGNKTLNGKVLNGGDFKFELYASDLEWNLGDIVDEAENAEDGTFSFKQLDFDKAGEYHYIVKEVDGGDTIDGVTYDDSEFRVCIIVTDNLRGQLNREIFIRDENNIPQEGIEFINEYKITGTGNVKLDGNKTLENRETEIQDGEFTFELYYTDETFEIDDTADETTVNTGEKFEFNLEYTKEDIGKTFYYVVIEANAGERIDGVTYSMAEYRITVTVEDDGVGGIKTTTTIKRENVICETLDFVNEYGAEAAVVDIEGTKKYENAELEGNDFTFELYNTGADFVINTDDVFMTTQNSADGTFKFEGIELNEAGTYFFAVKENTDEAVDNVVYDYTVYHVTITVADDGLGNLVEEERTIVKRGGDTAQPIVFKNEFVQTPPEVPNPPTGDTTNIGMWLTLLLISGGVMAITFTAKKKED